MFSLPTNVVLLRKNMFPHRELLFEDPGPIPGFVVLVHRNAPLYSRRRRVVRYDWVEDDFGYYGGPRKIQVPVYGAEDDFIHRYENDTTVWQAITQAEYDEMLADFPPV
jgi:hypothetical protein